MRYKEVQRVSLPEISQQGPDTGFQTWKCGSKDVPLTARGMTSLNKAAEILVVCEGESG